MIIPQQKVSWSWSQMFDYKYTHEHLCVNKHVRFNTGNKYIYWIPDSCEFRSLPYPKARSHSSCRWSPSWPSESPCKEAQHPILPELCSLHCNAAAGSWMLSKPTPWPAPLRLTAPVHYSRPPRPNMVNNLLHYGWLPAWLWLTAPVHYSWLPGPTIAVRHSLQWPTTCYSTANRPIHSGWPPAPLQQTYPGKSQPTACIIMAELPGPPWPTVRSNMAHPGPPWVTTCCITVTSPVHYGCPPLSTATEFPGPSWPTAYSTSANCLGQLPWQPQAITAKLSGPPWPVDPRFWSRW